MAVVIPQRAEKAKQSVVMFSRNDTAIEMQQNSYAGLTLEPRFNMSSAGPGALPMPGGSIADDIGKSIDDFFGKNKGAIPGGPPPE